VKKRWPKPVKIEQDSCAYIVYGDNCKQSLLDN